MGDRANVEVRDEGTVFLYTHWGGSELPEVVQLALQRGRSRWTDGSYLTRIIFSEMVKGDIDGLTGYGISTYEVEAGARKLVVDVGAQEVGLPNGTAVSFDDFCSLKLNEWEGLT